ncbi:DUF4241 domain-containing protein [Kibdelosporangium philippinense]|uniref:DUF4241 domain-containing protein n=1 Tax=Kibdelosporangium philippinense TaxID=211113 RepID=A0ABS8ZWG0_9PSEU|nr:DUF4241 domain-containing protein [Kibdelosporangium philippinense]MCE7010182.1 DUF4241 domain-containing protein [Kibdelosporangium philippinense]
MVTDGARLRTEDGRILTIKRTSAGTIRLPSGKLLVADAAWLHTDPKPLAATATPGTYPVDVFQVIVDGKPGETAACRVTVADVPVATWKLALRDGDHELDLGEGQFAGNPVNTATISLIDATGIVARVRQGRHARLFRRRPLRARRGGSQTHLTLCGHNGQTANCSHSVTIATGLVGYED